MKLYITPGSPYARMARIVVLEKGMESRVEIIVAQTRVAGSPYYRINPSGRVPYLIRDDGTGLEESAVICAYLDHLDGNPVFDLPAGDQAWEARRLEALARSMLDGLSVWGREITRPETERSPGVIQHETQRAQRTAPFTRSIHRAAYRTSYVTTASDWKSPPSSAPTSTTWAATRGSICQPATRGGRRAVSKRWREACWTAFQSGDAKSRGPNRSVRRG